MSASGADERSTRSWGSGTRSSSPGSRYVASRPLASVPSGGEAGTRAVARSEQSGHESDIVFVVKRDSTVLHVSFPDHRAPAGAVVGRSVMGFFAREFSADIIRKFENAFAFGEPQSFLCCGNPPLAVGSWYRCQVSPNHGASGVESATVFVRDITDWKHNEAEFRAEIEALRSQIAALSSENENLTDLLATQEQRDEELSRFREIMNHAGEAIFITDPHTGRFVDVNETACRWLRCSRDRLLKMGVGDLDLEFPLDSGDSVVDHVADTRGSFRPKALVLGSHRRRNGTSFPVEVTISPRLFGDRDYLLVVARDVKQRSRTDRDLLEEQTERRRLSEISRDAVYCSARDGTVCEVNDSALDLFGYTRDEFLGLEARRLFLRPEHITAFKRAVEEDGSVKNFHAQFKTKSGRWFEGFLGATLRYDADGNVQGYQCIIYEAENTGVDVDLSLAEAAQAKSVAEEARERADTLEREAERAKREVEDARLKATQARAEVEQAKLEIAEANSEAVKARARADALATEAERANREMQEAKSKARESLAETKAAQSELERAKLEIDKAKLDAEQARAEATQAQLDAEEAKQRAQQLEREAESAMTVTQKGVDEAARTWDGLDRPEDTTSNTQVLVKRRTTADIGARGSTLLIAPEGVNRRRKEPELWPKRNRWPAVLLALFAIAVVAAAGLWALWPN